MDATRNAHDPLAEQARPGHPPKRPGEAFGTYWRRISDGEAIGITLASKFIGVTPQSIFASYLRTEGEDA